MRYLNNGRNFVANPFFDISIFERELHDCNVKFAVFLAVIILKKYA